MRTKLARAERLVARIAANQHGAISLAQLLGAGLSPTAVKRRAEAGRLHRLYRGVYAVGHPNLSVRGRLMAAVLACGKGAVLSHESAAYLWSYSPTCPPLIHVTIPSHAGRAKRDGIVLHRSSTLRPQDVTRKHNIPVTKPARTLADCGFGPEPTRSWLERRFLALVREAQLPKPEVNRLIGPHQVDFLWCSERLVVEADGWGHHSDRATFQSDRRRDRDLRLRGYVVLRFTYWEVVREPEAVAAGIRAHLDRCRAA